jgi:hypothetical protein
MNPFIQKGTDTKPYVNFNCSKGVFKMGGIALPENVFVMFNPVKEWLHNYSMVPKKCSEFEFHFDYISTSASKMLFEIFDMIDKMQTDKSPVTIKWFYYRGDSEMHELGEELLSHITCPTEIIALDSDVTCEA